VLENILDKLKTNPLTVSEEGDLETRNTCIMHNAFLKRAQTEQNMKSPTCSCGSTLLVHYFSVSLRPTNAGSRAYVFQHA